MPKIFYNIIWAAAVLLLSLVFANFAMAAYEKWSPNDTIIIGEFVYDDDYVATTSGCAISIYNPSGNCVADNIFMTAQDSGWHYYSTTSPSPWAQGTWPSVMTCGTSTQATSTLDKTFVIGYVNASTTAISSSVWGNSATSSIAEVVNANTTNVVTTASSSLPSSIWNVATSTFTAAGSVGKHLVTTLDAAISNIASAVWGATTRTLSSFGTLAADVWNATYATTRTLSSALLGAGPEQLATESYINTATSTLTTTINTASSSVVAMVNTNTNTASSSIASVVNANTNAAVLNASTSLATSIPTNVWNATTRTLTSLGTLAADVWNVATSTFTTAGTAGKHLVLNLNAAVADVWTSTTRTLTAALLGGGGQLATESYINTATSILTTTIETASSSIPATVWSYSSRTLTGSPPQVIINSITDDTIPSISANVTITNEGSSGYEYTYQWCVVTSTDNACGGGDDVYYATASKYINAGESYNPDLSAVVPTAGNYFFKVVVESSGASRSFTAVSAPSGAVCGDGSCNGSETCSSCPTDCGKCGGGGGGIILELLKYFLVPQPALVPVLSFNADLNGDGRIGLEDLSIFLYLANEPSPNPADFNKDKKVNGEDLSIMFFKWTERIFAIGPEEEKPQVPSFFEEIKPSQPAAVEQAMPGKEKIKEEILVSKFINSAKQFILKAIDIVVEKGKEAIKRAIKFFNISL